MTLTPETLDAPALMRRAVFRIAELEAKVEQLEHQLSRYKSAWEHLMNERLEPAGFVALEGQNFARGIDAACARLAGEPTP